MQRKLAVQVAGAPRTDVVGTFYRHQSWKAPVGLLGSRAGGRWGPRDLYPVIYMGQPQDSVVVEAYRHLVEPFPEMTPELVARRRLLTCDVKVTNVLDLRSAEAQRMVGLSPSDLTSEVDDYDACQEVGRVAHQLEMHGVIAPAATGLGNTLALFAQHLPVGELPDVRLQEIWDRLPDDPRRLRVV